MTDDIYIALIEEHLDYALDLICKLEERIIALERAESVVHILPSDNYYWEHG